MKKVISLCLAILCIVCISHAQKTIRVKHSLNYEPTRALSFSYTGIYKQKYGIGIGLKIGIPGIDVLVNEPKYPMVSEIDGVSRRYAKIDEHYLYEYLKISAYYSQFVKGNTYFNIGPFLSFISVFDLNLDHMLGVEADIYYGWKVLKIGHRLKIGRISPTSGVSGGMLAITIQPLIVRFDF